MSQVKQDTEREERIMMEIVVDTYGPQEQAMGWYYNLQDTMQFPFTNESSILNNYVTEPQLYYAEYPTQEMQNRYKLQGAVAILLVTALFLLAFGIN